MYVYDVFGMLVCWLGNVLMVLCEIISISISKFSNLVLKRVEGQINYHQHTSTRSAQRNSTLKSAHQHTSTSAHSYLCAKACNSMSHHHHEEDHLKSSAFISDIVIGMADGLTVPFALAAGLSGAVHSNSVVITAGIAEIVAGSIAMGLGGYLAGKTEQEHYAAEWKREAEEVERIPEREKAEVREVFAEYGLSEETQHLIADEMAKDKQKWIEFMMKFELGLEEPHANRARNSAATIGIAYIVGGIIPLSAYVFTDTPVTGLKISSLLTVLCLFIFGYYKSKVTGQNPIQGALKVTFIGVIAAAAAFFVARMFDQLL